MHVPRTLRIRSRLIRVAALVFAAVLGATLNPLVASAQPIVPVSPVEAFVVEGGSGGTFTNSSISFPVDSLRATTISPTAIGHNNGDRAVHVFSVAPNSDGTGDLLDNFAPDITVHGCITASFICPSSVDVTQQTGAIVSGSTPVGALYVGGNQPSTQVFALSPGGDLLSFVAPNDGPTGYQVFDLSGPGFANSSARLTTGPSPILFGSTVHVYVTDDNKHLHDFYKQLTANWVDIDLTRQTGVHSIFGEPYAYGGNSIQIVTTSSGGDELTEVQLVNPDGTLVNPNAAPFVTDISNASGGFEFPRGTPKPVVTGDNTVNIFVDDTNGNLVDFIKTPNAQWQVATVASLGVVNLTPAPIWDRQLGLHVLTNNSACVLHQYFTNSDSPPFNSEMVGSGSGFVGDPAMVVTAVSTDPNINNSAPALAAFSNLHGC